MKIMTFSKVFQYRCACSTLEFHYQSQLDNSSRLDAFTSWEECRSQSTNQLIRHQRRRQRQPQASQATASARRAASTGGGSLGGRWHRGAADGGGTQADSKKREKKMESHKNKVVEMGSKSSALKGSPFVCTQDDRTLVPDRPARHLAPRALRRLATVLLGGCLAQFTSKKSPSFAGLDSSVVVIKGRSSISVRKLSMGTLSRTTPKSCKLRDTMGVKSILKSNMNFDKVQIF